MNLIDANLLLYAEDARSPLNNAAKTWLDNQLKWKNPCLIRGLAKITFTFSRVTWELSLRALRFLQGVAIQY